MNAFTENPEQATNKPELPLSIVMSALTHIHTNLPEGVQLNDPDVKSGVVIAVSDQPFTYYYPELIEMRNSHLAKYCQNPLKKIILKRLLLDQLVKAMVIVGVRGKERIDSEEKFQEFMAAIAAKRHD